MRITTRLCSLHMITKVISLAQVFGGLAAFLFLLAGKGLAPAAHQEGRQLAPAALDHETSNLQSAGSANHYEMKFSVERPTTARPGADKDFVCAIVAGLRASAIRGTPGIDHSG
jgi:hypothetical protein